MFNDNLYVLNIIYEFMWLSMLVLEGVCHQILMSLKFK